MPLSSLTAALLAKSSGSSSSSSGSVVFLVILVAFFALYLLVLRPRSRRARQQTKGNTNLAIGDEVVSAGGILGTVTAIAGDEIVVEVGPGVTLTFWRRAVNLRSSVAGAPQSSPVGEPSEPYTSEPYAAEPYTEETYSDESYADESYLEDNDTGTYGEEEYGEEADGDGGGEEMTEADHRDISGGSDEGV